MPRPIWSGAINFGLVTIPVALFSATEDHSVHFNQFQRGTSDRIRYKRVNERTGDEVPYNDIVKGREEPDGSYVIVEPEDLEAIAPGKSRSIEIDAFVDLDEIDPIFFQKTYWLGPAGEQYAKPYRLLLEAMARTNKAGIATFVMRGKQYLTAIRADNGVLALNTMLFADEIRDPKSVLGDLPEAENKPRELEMARSLIESMTGEWEPEQYKDTYTERVEQLIEDKRAGKTIPAPESEDMGTDDVIDLVEVLRRSVEESRGKRAGGKTAAKPAAKSKDLSELSKAELEARARELDIKGRSKMNRAELEKAIKESRRKKAS